jgi:hypothetical protein
LMTDNGTANNNNCNYHHKPSYRRSDQVDLENGYAGEVPPPFNNSEMIIVESSSSSSEISPASNHRRERI